MKKLLIALVLSIIAAGAIAADVHVDGYTRRDGTYVQPHHRTAPDSRLDNNYGSQGNMNPYSGQMGTRDPYAQPQPRSDPYGQPQQRQRGF
jgi:opacity protein-like surface antigen